MPLVMIKSDPRARLKPCLRCGYSLRNVPDARVCPECGLPVWLTLGGNDDLEMSNPQWLRRVSLGAALLAVANAALVMAAAMIHAGHHLWDAGGRVVAFVAAAAPENTLLPWSLAVYLAVSACGLFLLGAHEGRYPERARNLRKTVFACAALAAAFGIWLVAWRLTRNTRPPMFLLAAATCGQAAAGWIYLTELARRMPSQRLVRLFRALAIALGIAVLTLVFSGRFRLYLALIDPWSRFAIAWTLFLLIYPPASVVVLARLARILRRAAKRAETNWGPDPAT